MTYSKSKYRTKLTTVESNVQPCNFIYK